MVFYDGERTDLDVGDWQEWNIALSEFAEVNLPGMGDITVGVIGLGDAGNPGGLLSFDDIRLYPSRCVPKYGPLADLTDDCVVDVMDLRELLGSWLLYLPPGPPCWAGLGNNADIGNVDPAGSYSFDGVTHTIEADGGDIWGSDDAFHYAYQQVSGDTQMTVRPTSLANTNTWAKAGVMIRDDLDPNSTHVFMAVTVGQGVALQGRDVKGGGSFNIQHGGRSVPICLRLVRIGDTFRGYFYEDGMWKLAGTRTVAMADPVHIGLAVTSHNHGVLTTATFDCVCSGELAEADLNDDAAVNLTDYAIMMEEWLDEKWWP
jgi:hypothetical protein